VTTTGAAPVALNVQSTEFKGFEFRACPTVCDANNSAVVQVNVTAHVRALSLEEQETRRPPSCPFKDRLPLRIVFYQRG